MDAVRDCVKQNNVVKIPVWGFGGGWFFGCFFFKVFPHTNNCLVMFYI